MSLAVRGAHLFLLRPMVFQEIRLRFGINEDWDHQNPPDFPLGLSFCSKIWYPSRIFIISRKNICVLPGIPRIFSKGLFLLRRKGRNKKQTTVLRSDFEVGPEQMLGNMVAELRFGWLEIAMFQTTLTFLEPLWSFKIYAKYMVDTWKTSTYVAS